MNRNMQLAINGGRPVRRNPIPIHKPYLDQSEMNALTAALSTTFLSGDGPECRRFEQLLSDYLDVRHVFFTNSCTAALDLAFRVKEFPRNAEVIVPNFTYTSTALAPLLNNLDIVLVDVSPRNGNVSADAIESAITDNTVAITPVDYAGNPVDMEPIIQLAKIYGLHIVHDAAQSLGAVYKGKKSGKLSDVCCFSFHGTKNITTGEGGALATDSDEIADKVRIMRDKGTDKYSFLSDKRTRGFYNYVSMGHSYVQSNLLAALGISQLAKMEIILKRRKEIAAFFTEEFHNLEGIQLPHITENSGTNWHIFYLLVTSIDRDIFIDEVNAEGIGCNLHYKPLHMNSYYADTRRVGSLDNSEFFYNHLVRIPLYPSLTDEECEDIVRAVKKVIDHHSH